MLFNEDAIKKLLEEQDQPERGASSDWVESFKDYKYEDGKFLGKWLPEGQGRKNKTIIHDFIHYLLQTPFRLKGRKFKEFYKILRTAKRCHENRNGKLGMATLRQVISLSLLEDEISLSQFSNPIVIIGDGFGLMASLILLHFNQLTAKVVVINLKRNLLIDAVFINKTIPKLNIALVKNEIEYKTAVNNDEVSCILIEADNANLIGKENISLGINIVSMQEMNPNIIEEYFDFIRQSKNSETYFYCENRIEKILQDGTITNFFKYPWNDDDKILIDGLCPWTQKYYSYKYPFYFPYDGKVQHRLVLLKK